MPIDAETNNIQVGGHESIVLAGYRFTFDLVGREGKPAISPYLGVGTLFGSADVVVTSTGGGQSTSASGSTITLELDAVLGAHWRLSEHLGLRAQVGVSSYGGFGAMEPRVGAYANF